MIPAALEGDDFRFDTYEDDSYEWTAPMRTRAEQIWHSVGGATMLGFVTRGFIVERSSSAQRNSLANLLSFELPARRTATRNEIIGPEVGATFRAGVVARAVNAFVPRDNLFEIRRLTGFTWNEIAALLCVDRRTVHNWVKGSAIREANRNKVADALRVLRYLDRGAAAQNRTILALREAGEDAVSDLISKDLFEEAKRRAGPGITRPSQRWATVDPGWIDEYGPLPLGVREMADPEGAMMEIAPDPAPPSRARKVTRR